MQTARRHQHQPSPQNIPNRQQIIDQQRQRIDDERKAKRKWRNGTIGTSIVALGLGGAFLWYGLSRNTSPVNENAPAIEIAFEDEADCEYMGLVQEINSYLRTHGLPNMMRTGMRRLKRSLQGVTPGTPITVEDVSAARETFRSNVESIGEQSPILDCTTIDDLFGKYGIAGLLHGLYTADASDDAPEEAVPQTQPGNSSQPDSTPQPTNSWNPSRDINPRRHESLIRRVNNYNHGRYTGI